MPRFFLEELDESDICITGPDARHIGLSLRMRVGDPLTVCAYGKDYQCRIRSITPEEVHLEMLELGAVRIVPVLTRRCISRPKSAEFAKKLPRLQKIAASAAKQAGRGMIPEIAALYTFQQMCREMQEADRAILMYENGGIRFSQVPFENCHTIAMAVGSEGGFDPEEAEQLQNAGAVSGWESAFSAAKLPPSLPSPLPCTAPEICKSFQKQFKKVDRIINIVAKKDLYFFRKHGILITEPEHRPVHIKDQALENGITGGADRGQQALHSYISTLADFLWFTKQMSFCRFPGHGRTKQKRSWRKEVSL